MSKLQSVKERVSVPAQDAVVQLLNILNDCGCARSTAEEVAQHLVDASLCGVESHGVMRILQYVEQFRSGYMRADVRPVFQQCSSGCYEVNGQEGIGVPAMAMAVEKSYQLADTNGIAAIAIRDAGHTGRLGAFAEIAANDGYLVIMMGGGNRKTWRQVAPYGGRQAMLPTNPYCIGIPGGDRGPVILDFATSQIAGGWIYAAQSAGAKLPEGMVIDRQGAPTTDPADFFDGGAILPAGGAKGYALALVAELIGEAMLGPATTECNWLMIVINTGRYRDSSNMQSIAEEILSELRDSPPAPGFDRVEIPGERERLHKQNSRGIIEIPKQTWDQILHLAR